MSTRRRGAPTRAPKACFCPRLGLYHLEPQPLSAGWLLRATAFGDVQICQAGTPTAFARVARSAVRAKASLGFRAGSAGCAIADVQLNFDQTTIADAVSSSGDVQNGPTDD